MECQRCKVFLPTLKRCSGCHRVAYCSRACQKADWEDHKVFCKSTWSKLHDTSKKKRNLHNADQDKKNQQFTKVEAGSADSSKSEQQRKPLKEAGDVEGCCVVCNKDTKKQCARCKQVSYCSKRCQKLDWKNHKPICEQPESIDEEEVLNPFIYLAHQMLEQCMMEDMLSLKFITTEEDFGQAIDVVNQLFPLRTVISSLYRVPSENMFFRPKTTDILVAFITRFHHYRARHCVYIEDKDDEEMYVAFYFVGDFPYPFFKWSDVRPGKFIAIQNPCIHFFIDGSIGFRIDDPSEVIFIEI